MSAKDIAVLVGWVLIGSGLTLIGWAIFRATRSVQVRMHSRRKRRRK